MSISLVLRGGMGKPETNPSVHHQQEQVNSKEGKVIADNELDIDYKPKGLEPDIEPVDHEEEDMNSDAEHAKMELPCYRTMQQRSMKCKVAERIKNVH